MTSSSWTCQAALLVFVVLCACSFTQSRDVSLHRQKRGFRLNSASRVAHGYGKRGYDTDASDVTAQLARDALDQLMADEARDYDGWSLMSVEQLSKLIQTHPKLARALVKKYIDVNDDGVITADELFTTPSRA